MRISKLGIAMFCFIGVFIILQQSEEMNAYVVSLKSGNEVPVFQSSFNSEFSSDNQLLEKIKREAERRRIEPVDAKIDRVWKAIPGYNGLEVDIDTTYRYALKYGKDDFPIFYHEVPPKIDLQDLKPAPIYKGNSNKPMVALMINVAWGNEYIPRMLEILKQENVRATFFFDGRWLNENRELALQIIHEGHEASNHGYSHRNMSELDRESAIEEMMKTQKLLKEVLEVDNQWFAPPSGDYDQETVLLAHELGLKTVLWTIDTVDWKNPSPSWIKNRIETRIEPGALILMHPTDASTKALSSIISVIKQKDLHLGTVSELLSPNRFPTVEPPIKVW